MNKTVLAITVNEITNDNRVINYTNALALHGFKTLLVCPAISNFQKTDYHFSPIFIKIITKKLPPISIFNYLKLIEFFLKVFFKSMKWNPDIIHANDLKGLMIAALIKRRIHSDVKIVYDAHEYETETNGLQGVQKKVYQYLEKRYIQDVYRMITVSDTIANEYVRLYGIEKPTVLLNVPQFSFDKNLKYDLFRERFKIRNDQRIFLYQGYLMPGRGIEILLESFNQLQNDNDVIIFMGKGSLTDLIRNYYPTGKIYYHEFVNPKEYLNFTSSADVGISFIEDISLSDRYCLPNKLFEYMFCGLPIICSNLPEMRKLVEEHSIGIVAKENSIEGFRKAIEEVDSSGLDFFKQNLPQASSIYSWANQEKRLINLYNQL
uniref:glycosyltransferase family 4 protein n=1 Tax=Algoriphagus sp. TaxID=1872435 RepID=UPI00404871FF